MTSAGTHLPDRPRTILVVDADRADLDSLVPQLRAAGFTVVAAHDPDVALRSLTEHEVSAVIVSLALSRPVLELVRRCEGLQPSVVVRGPLLEAAIRDAYDHGADDYISIEAPGVELLGRTRGLLRNRDILDQMAEKQRDAQVMLELTQALASSLDFSEILHAVVRRIADVVNVDRASIVLVPDADAPEVGFVVATSDDREIDNLQIDLEKYPEILQVLSTREPLTIADAATHPVLDGVRASVPSLNVGALTLLPIVLSDVVMGVLFLRSARPGALLEREMNFCRIVANATAIALRNARVMQSLRDQTQRVNVARYEAERRLLALKRYANLFNSAADGLAAVDPDGRMLFANPRAFEIAGVRGEELDGSLLDLIDPGEHPMLRDLWRRVRRGDYPRGVDVRMRATPDHEARIISCSFSELVESEGAILVSFRDVTSDRRTAAELVKTKEFLESLIHASVDGIIAADLRGHILVYNQGAERIYGYEQEAALRGEVHVSHLYPEGGAQRVMRMLRSEQFGGPGRLANTRFEAMDRDGQIIPITLSAAMIYDEQGRPSATVGIFSDQRDRIRVEERLAQAQQKLEVTEKQALIAELAGTAAHELNQPLTSVIGYGELLQRKLPIDSAEQHAAQVIVREAERMADIVRKIGKITRYETKSYVGAQKILDLDKSAGADDDTAGGGVP